MRKPFIKSTSLMSLVILSILATPINALGANGLQGPIGKTGPAGPQGPIGKTGMAGPAGSAGSIGSAGPAGSPGPKGSAGPAGSAGPGGSVGPKGDKGNKGDIGLAGLRGPTGAAGTNGTYSNSFPYAMTCGISGTDACKVGAIGPGGGWIFFVDKDDEFPGFTYLEAAPTDIAANVWCNNQKISIFTTAQYWTLRGVGQGKTNTEAMVAFCTSGAANDAVNYSTSTATSGWFLPSLGELMLMYNNLQVAGVGGFVVIDRYFSDSYWSSSELSSDVAWVHHFPSGNYFDNNKGDTNLVRAVRAF